MTTHGFTLVQLMVGVSILSILLTTGMPSFADFQHRQHLRQILNQSLRMFNEARQLAILQRQTVNVVVQTGRMWCLGATTDSTCNCHLPTDCVVNDKPMRISAGSKSIQLADSRKQSKAKIVFDGNYGTAYGSANTLSFAHSIGIGKVIINNLGRVRICAEEFSSVGIQRC
ncbi:GspH/FimT family pseudopilin [Alteromonas sp. ASW11-130]|uniref:GspH/FimT family pseudopilin n=1 Tax=Alteromonas sp. ASW11-130 TaxID=3015775 RepID=UPI002242B0D9|nr:GspH/FimT family pseudopilin [Alteromonas sp. ASW11-130]MCW8092916.1 GspH/FimT family pseudopilin [Alteromonas sp. ASW11-130]